MMDTKTPEDNPPHKLLHTRFKLNVHWSLVCEKFYELVQFFVSLVLRESLYTIKKS